MSDGVTFDEEMLETIQRLYRTTSMASRREWIRTAADLDPGDAVLSIGTGPGFEAEGLAGAVGETGRVHGIDTAEAMLSAARDRCDHLPQVSFEQGDATALPVEDASYDVAFAVQVYEYVPDLEAAFAELDRVLRPGGRAIVFDSDWTTMTYHAADPDRSARVLRGFDAHCPHPRLARTLKPRLERANFSVTDQDVYVHFETEFNEDGVGAAFIPAVAGVAADRGGVDPATVEAWVDDLNERADEGEFFFSFNQYLFVGEKGTE